MRPPTTRPRRRRPRPGFTLVELLVVIMVLALLVAMLLPAINGAVRRAREASVSAESNQLAQALADFKSKYGDYPPSRVYLNESGDYRAVTSTTSIATTGTADINLGQLAQRSLIALRKFFPRVNFSTTSQLFASGSTTWYDFNGNGQLDNAYVLDGRECLAFFLGGIPQYGSVGGTFQNGMTGFGRNPTNPFTHSIVAASGTAMYSNNRQAPFFEFKGDRLGLIPGRSTGVPGYYDANSSKSNPAYYAYFSAYGGAYDPNDVNTGEADDNGTVYTLNFKVNFPVYSSGSTSQATFATSQAPNPYTVSKTVGTVSYQNPQTFQIISPGADLFYGIGGQYVPNEPNALPFDTTSTPSVYNTSNAGIRQREQDNVTNFHNGRLE